MKHRVAAIVVTYNRKELLLKCVDCLLKQQGAKCDIIIVDNASSDGTEQAIKSLSESLSAFSENNKLIYFNTGANLGGAGGFNFGIRKGAELGFEYLWIMDDDCMAHNDTLVEFLKADKKLNGDYGFLSSVVLWKDGSICTMNVQKISLFKYITDFNFELSKVILASFVSLFIPVKIVREMGLPIKEFFIWTDDWEYSRRISKKYNCYAAGKSVVTHESVSNIGANIVTDSKERLERFKYLYRNDVYLYRREGLKGFLYELVRLSKHIISVLFKSKGNRIYKCKIIIGSTLKGLNFKPPIEYLESKNNESKKGITM